MSLGFVTGLANEPVFPYDFHNLAVETRAFLEDASQSTQGNLDLKPVLAAAAELVAATQRLNTKLAARATADVDATNRTLRSLARLLLPLTFTTEGCYTHEAADITPMMSTHRGSMYPGINRAFGLPDLAPDDRLFLQTHLVRQANSFRDTLQEAARIADAY